MISLLSEIISLFKGITCGALPSPDHGTFECSDGDTYNSVCEFRCNEGYKLSGSLSRTCLDDHRWSGQEAECSCKCLSTKRFWKKNIKIQHFSRILKIKPKLSTNTKS